MGPRVQIQLMKDKKWGDSNGKSDLTVDIKLPRSDGLSSKFHDIARGGGRAGVVGSHEEDFAAAVVMRGWDGLSCLEQLLHCHYASSGRCFVSPLDLSHCFCQAGIEMEEGTIEALVLGLGCDTAGKVDATEVLQAVSYFIYLVFAYL